MPKVCTFAVIKPVQPKPANGRGLQEIDTEIMEVLLGIVLGGMLVYTTVSLFKRKQGKELTEKQSVILLDKIRNVCKLITVEGEFAEIYHHENTREHLLGLISSKKKALIVVNAKAHIGFDMSKIEMHANTDRRQIVITRFPQPEVLSLEPDLKFYDIQNGLLNKFASEDLTTLNKEAKQQILDKIPESSLMVTARKEAKEAVLLIEKIVETIGWKLDYSALEITDEKKNLLENK